MQKVKELFSSKDDTSSHSNVSGNTRSGNQLDNTSGHGLTNESSQLSGVGAGKHNLDSTTGGAHIGTTGQSSVTGSRTGHLEQGLEREGLSSGRTGTHNVGTGASELGANATHDHQHLAAVTKERQHLHETEEVTRLREHDRHVHHVASHVQPIKDTVHAEAAHHHKTLPTEELRHNHASTTEDQRAFERLHAGHRDETIQGQRDRNVIDKGEAVTENVHHHVHHVVQPVIERDVHEHTTHHTQIPVHQVTHEAPIIHGVQKHEPMAIKDFLAGGGDLSSNTTAKTAGVLANATDNQATGHQHHQHHEHGTHGVGSHVLSGKHDSANLTGNKTGALDSSATRGSGLVTDQSAGVEGRGVGSEVRDEARRL